MNKISNQILFWDLQVSKSRNNKKEIKALYDTLIRFKTIKDSREFGEIYDAVYASNSANIYLTCNLFPKKISDVGKYTEVRYTNDVVTELRWQLKIIGKHTEAINDFLIRREEIDEHIFFERYQEAENKIVEFETMYGVSLWLMEEKVCVYNNLKKDAKEITKGCVGNMIKSIVDFYIMRSSSEVTYTDYRYFVQRELSKFYRMHPDEDNVVSMYHYMIAPDTFEMNDENVLYLLRFIYNLPLFDRYLCIIDLCEYIVTKSKKEEFVKCVKNHLQYLLEIEDSALLVLNVMMGELNEKVSTTVLEDPLLVIKDNFISGKLDDCINKLTLFINNNKFNIQAYNILVEVVQLTNTVIEMLEINEVCKRVLYHLMNVYAINQEFYDSLEKIRKKIISCIHSQWARDLYNSIIRRNNPIGSEQQKYAIKYSNFQHLTIETICENLDFQQSNSFLRKICFKSIYFKFWYAYLNNDFIQAESCCQIADIVNLLKVSNKVEYKYFAVFLYRNDVSSIMKNRFAQKMWKNISEGHEMEASIDYFLKLFVIREDYAMVAPINKFIEYVKCSRDINRGDLRVPILHYINSTYFDNSKRDELTIACENFFDLNRIDKPSKLINFNLKYGKEKLVFFLKNICVPQIMGPVLLSIRTVKGLDQERIDTCQLLRQIDQNNEEIYESEIMELTRKLFINEGLLTIESNKIHVNTDGLKSKLVKTLKSEFNSFLYYRNHQIDSVLQTIKNIEGGEHLQIITFDESQMFNEIVYKIRNEFALGGEYSLDGYLSINIRHGVLDGHLRAPLSKYNLLTTYRVEKDDYDVNERWMYAIKDSVLRKEIKEAVVEFNKKIESIINNWKNNLIQVSTEERPTQGVFDYSLNESDIRLLQTYLTENISLDEFIDILFEYFWKITEENLLKMKTIISEDISLQINNAFEKLSGTFRRVNEMEPFPEALRWLGSLKNEMDEELDKVSNWFNRSVESQQADFDIEYATQIGLKMIQSIYPEKEFVLKITNKKADYKISGKYLKCFWDIFYTQFDNISKYALAINDVISIECELLVDKTHVYIKMINDYDCRKELDKEIEKISSAQRIISEKGYLAKAKQEGGSGIPKIYKIMSSDLNMRTSVNCGFEKDHNKFYIEIEGVFK